MNNLDTLLTSWEDKLEVVKKEKLVLRPELLLTGERPIVFQGLNPRGIMGQKKWGEVRRKVYASTDYHCLSCGAYRPYDLEANRFIDEPLHAHELYIIDWKNKRMFLGDIVPLCIYCHNYIHQHGMVIRYEKGQNTIQDCWESIDQGLRVCGEQINNINAVKTFKNEWNKWVFIHEGKEYRSKYKSYNEWKKKEV